MNFKTINKIIKYIIFLLVTTLVIIVLIEGVSSLVLFTMNIFKPTELPESFHVQYDELLGWTNVPNLDVKDSYGPDIYFKTNSQLFRNNNDFTEKIPPGKIRVICSGDSHTLGVGVDNDNTWCQLLSSFDEKMETVNMGQGGYGIDQAYLWYKRDGTKLDHDILIFAFIEDDFRRVKHKRFWGYYKPVFKVENDSLILENVPVPKAHSSVPTLTLAYQSIGGFRAYQLLKSLKDKTGAKILLNRGFDEDVREVSLKIFEELYKVTQAEGSTLVTLYIPIASDYTKEVPWRKFLTDELAKRNILFIDLTEEIKKQPMHLMFSGHYTKYGNKYLATVLYDKLVAIPELRNKFPKNQ